MFVKFMHYASMGFAICVGALAVFNEVEKRLLNPSSNEAVS